MVFGVLFVDRFWCMDTREVKRLYSSPVKSRVVRPARDSATAPLIPVVVPRANGPIVDELPISMVEEVNPIIANTEAVFPSLKDKSKALVEEVVVVRGDEGLENLHFVEVDVGLPVSLAEGVRAVKDSGEVGLLAGKIVMSGR
ncbi:hypothetical protein ACOSP7_028397 [Xanthoceras sorbifolium]